MLTIIPEKRISINELNINSFIKDINIIFDENIEHDLIIKAIFVGDSAVGNNSLANSFLRNIPYFGNYTIIGLNFQRNQFISMV